MKKIFQRSSTGHLIGFYEVRLAPVTYAAIELFHQQMRAHTPIIRSLPKIGRNDLCLCKSGKKYKYCHGK